MLRFIVLSVTILLATYSGPLRAALHTSQSPEVLAQLFLTPTMNKEGMAAILNVIARISATVDRGDVVRRAHTFVTPTTSVESIVEIIRSIASIPQKDRDDVVHRLPKLFTDNMTEKDYYIIAIIAEIPLEQRDDVIDRSQKLFTQNMSVLEKSHIIGAISEVPLRQRDDVLMHAHSLFFRGISAYDKSEIINAISQMPYEQRAHRCQEAMERFHVAQQRREIHGQEGPAMTALLRGEELPQPQVRSFATPTTEVHQYAAAEVEDHSSRRSSISDEGEACVAKPKSNKLNDVILREVGKRVQGRPIKSITDVQTDFKTKIHEIWLDAPTQERAQKAFIGGFNHASPQDIEDLCSIFTFVQQEYPKKMEIWIQQFLGESMEAYEDGVSCVKGIRERAVLGLRGMDAALDKIFIQVEGSVLDSYIFLRSNFVQSPQNAKFVANKLIEQGYRSTTTAEQAGKLYEGYLKGILRDNASLARDPNYRDQPEGWADLIEGDLERGEASVLRPHLRTVIAEKALKPKRQGPPTAPKPVKPKKKGPPIALKPAPTSNPKLS